MLGMATPSPTSLGFIWIVMLDPQNIAVGVARRNILGFYMDNFFLGFPLAHLTNL
jgi:hypothetical protein